MSEPIYDFTWKGKSAHTDFGVEVTKISSTVIAERRDETHVIAGRSGLVHDQDGAVEEIEHCLEIYIPYAQAGASPAPFREIRRWLKGYGKLTLSNQPDRFMLAYITDMIGLDPVMQGFEDLQGSIIFRCEPWLYHTDAEAITLTEAAILANPGDASAAPIITINATGDLDLMIGSQTVLLHELDGQIILNCAVQEAYIQDANGVYTNLNSQMSGDFPLLGTGNVAISWSLGDDASFENIIIDPRWRDEG